MALCELVNKTFEGNERNQTDSVGKKLYYSYYRAFLYGHKPVAPKFPFIEFDEF